MKGDTFESDLNLDLNILIYLLNVCLLQILLSPWRESEEVLTDRYYDDPYLPSKCFESRRNLC
jgi:hypothetical protein